MSRSRGHLLLLAVSLAFLAVAGTGGSAGASDEVLTTVGPGMAGPDGVVPEIILAQPRTGTRDEDMSPLDASGCNGDVCIWLTGSGLQVDNWETRGYPDSYRCGYAKFWRNGQVIATSNTACGGSGTVFYSSYGSGWFADGTQLCNTWTNLAGKPCKTVSD